MRGAQVLRLPEQEGTWEELGKHWAPAPSPSQKSRHPRMRELKMGLASNGGTSPLHSGYWCHSQRDRWETGKWLQWRGGGKEDESPAWGREAVWTCQLHTGNLSEYASVTWLMQENSRRPAHLPVSIRFVPAGNAATPETSAQSRSELLWAYVHPQ